MTLDRARQFLAIQVSFGSGYNANSAKLVLSEVQKEHGQAVVDQLIREMGLEQVFGFVPGTHFENGIAIKN
jgi:nucleotidyltransferase/DNA polymerase involved in DNA repair